MPLFTEPFSAKDIERSHWTQVKYLVVGLTALSAVAGILYTWLSPVARKGGGVLVVCGALLAVSVLFLLVPTVLPRPDGRRPAVYGVWVLALAVVAAALARFDYSTVSPFIILFLVAIVLGGVAASWVYVVGTGAIGLAGYGWLHQISGAPVNGASYLAGSMLLLLVVIAVWMAAVPERRARLLASMTGDLSAQMATVQWVIDASPAGVCISDADDRIVRVNSAACEMAGLSREELIGAPAHETFHPCHRDGSPFPKEECDAQAALRSGVEQPLTEDVYIRADGTPYDVEANAVPTPDGGVMVAFTDITERLATQRLKDEFMSVISHELRTPLTSVRGALGLLAAGAAGELQPQVAKMVSIASSNTDRLSRLINDILDVERIRSGKAVLEVAVIDAFDAICASVDEMRALAMERFVELRCEGQEVMVHADRDRVQQVVVNLLSNAIKFSEPGSAVVVTTGVAGGEARIDVSDRGRGIPQELRERIFKRFEQVDASDSRVMDGVGLGLAICEGIVSQHGGRIWVDSTVGSGSTFSFTLPLAPAAESGNGDRQGRALSTDGHDGRRRSTGPRVLIVEDDADLAEVLAANFKNRGVETAITGSWIAAKKWCEDALPGVVLLDLILADGSGGDLVSWLQETGKIDRLGLVVYTALDVDSWHRIEMGLSENDLFVKSQAPPEVVVSRVLQVLEARTPANLAPS